MLLLSVADGSVVAIGKNRAYAPGDTAYRVRVQVSPVPGEPVQFLLLPVTWRDDRWCRSSYCTSFFRDGLTEVTVL